MKTGMQVFVQRVVDETFEADLVRGVEPLPALADFGWADGHGESFFNLSLDFAL